MQVKRLAVEVRYARASAGPPLDIHDNRGNWLQSLLRTPRSQTPVSAAQVKRLAAEVGVAFHAVGHDPGLEPEEVPMVHAKRRVAIQKDYYSGSRLALDVMNSTASVQVTAAAWQLQYHKLDSH